jgi:hypothetical protein
MNMPHELANQPNVTQSKANRTRFLLTGLAVLMVCVLALAFQWPTIHQVFPGGDDSGYLFDGVRFVEQGVWMPLGSGPLAGILNGAIYAFFPRDHMLLGDVSAVRRTILLMAILAAVGIAGCAVGGKRTALVSMVLAAMARPVSTVLENTADSTYAALAGLSFAALLWAWPRDAGENRLARGLLAGSGLLMGVAALARLDGLFLGCILIVALWFLRGQNKSGLQAAAVFAGGLALPLLVFMLSYGIATGRWDPQFGQRSYLAFEQGHNFLYSGRYDVVPTPSASDLYGTAEQNSYSVPRALLNNPRAFAARIPLVLANAVRMFYNAYSIIGGLLFLFLVAAGLLIQGSGRMNAVRVFAWIWCAPLAGYLLASYRPGFSGTVFPELMTLAVLGALPILKQARTLAASIARPALAVWGLVTVGAIASQAQFVLEQAVGLGAQQRTEAVYRGWLQELETQVPRGACIITEDGAAAIYSNHVAYPRWTIFYEVKTPEDLRRSMETDDCRYMIAGEGMQEWAPDFLAITEKTLEPMYISADRAWTIYRLPQ